MIFETKLASKFNKDRQKLGKERDTDTVIIEEVFP